MYKDIINHPWVFAICCLGAYFALWVFNNFILPKCPKCNGKSFRSHSQLNTSGNDYNYTCKKCKHKWYVDNTQKPFKL
jgi:hypothetical protein